MKPTLIPLSLALAATVLTSPGAWAQDPPPQNPAAISGSIDPHTGDPMGAPPEIRFDLELPGKTSANEVIKWVAEQVRHPVNVVWTADSENVSLPALRLHQVTIREFFAAITAAGRAEQLQGHPGFAFTEVEGAPNIFTFTTLPAPSRPSPPASPAAGLQRGGGEMGFANAAHPASAKTLNPKSSQFFDVSDLIGDDLTIDDLTTAIRTAWAASIEGAEPPADSLRFHQETKLLIATGTPDQLQVVSSLVELLTRRTQPSTDDKDRQIQNLQHSLEERAREIDRLRHRFDEMDKESSAMSAKLRDRIAELEIELVKAGAKR